MLIYQSGRFKHCKSERDARNSGNREEITQNSPKYLILAYVNYDNIDLLIAGAGPVGCVVAERAATQLGWRCLLVDKRHHIGGTCYDYIDENGLLVHKYGPHYFHTANVEVLRYLSQITAWIPANYQAQSFVNGRLYPFPINIATIRDFFGKPELTIETAQQFLQEKQIKNDNPQNAEKYILSQVGQELYEAFYLNYLQKKWGKHPAELEVSVINDELINWEENNSSLQFNIMPVEGYSKMFEQMTTNPLINIVLEEDYRELKNTVKPAKATLYTGPIDEYFGKMHGELPWRTVGFEFQSLEQEYCQKGLEINYPNNHEYTRTVEIKHITRQKTNTTAVAYEYPGREGECWFPEPGTENKELHNKYLELARYETMINKVYFAGRLANYTYMNTDEAIQNALEVFEQIKTDFSNNK